MKTIYYILLLMMMVSCTKDKVPQDDPSNKDAQCNGDIATMQDYSSIGGCGWILVLQSGMPIEPINIGDFGITLVAGKEVCIQFHELPAGSICMVGPVVELDSMTE